MKIGWSLIRLALNDKIDIPSRNHPATPRIVEYSLRFDKQRDYKLINILKPSKPIF